MNLSMMRGDTTELLVTLTDPDGEPLDLDDVADITFTAKLCYDDSADARTTIVKYLGNGIEPSGYPDAGEVVILINPEDTSGFTSSYKLMWDIQIEGEYLQDVHTVARGDLFVYMDVTVTAT